MASDGAQLSELGLAIKRAQWRHHRELDRRLIAIGGSLAQWDAVRQIAQNPGASMHHLAELTFQSDQSFGSQATRLITRGLVERVQGPGRTQHHVLTTAGQTFRAAGQKVADEVLADSFAALDRTQLTQLQELLGRLNGESSQK